MFGSITVKERPLRMGFLVRPSEPSSVRLAIQISSSLWGGAYNPLIPILRRTPPSWRDGRVRPPTARDIFTGYVKAFDPDFLVACTADIPAHVSESQRPVISNKDVWAPLDEDEGENYPRYGVGVFELAEQIFDQYFRYRPRYPVKLALPQIPQLYALFWASFFGEWPERIHALILKHYIKHLDIETPKVKAGSLGRLLARNVLFPRRLINHDCDELPRGFDRNARLFFCDARRAMDVIDYWNLRALGRPVLPVPIHLANDGEWSGLVISFLKRHRGPNRRNKKLFECAAFIKSRSLPFEEMQSYARGLNLQNEGPERPHYSLQQWYPRIWDDWARLRDGAEAPDVYSNEDPTDAETVSSTLRVPSLVPSFAFKHSVRRETVCANDVSVNLYGEHEPIAEVFPRDSGEAVLRAIEGVRGLDDWRIGRDGLVRLLHFGRAASVALPRGQDILFAWLQDKGWQAQLSTTGILAKQMLRQLGGAARLLAYEDLLKLLERMNGGSASADEQAAEREPVAREFAVGEVKKQLQQMTKFFDLHDRLVSKSVFQVGLAVQCPICQRRSWYRLEEIKDTITCPKCLVAFHALGNIDSGNWRYRTAGPFSIPRYGEGAYTVLLLLETLQNGSLSTRATTAALSFACKNSDGKEIEADLALLWQERSAFEPADGVLFAECKSYGIFERKDFQRMQLLGTEFPGAILAFATLKTTLTASEIRSLRALTNRGRKYWKNERPQNPVLIITGRELFSKWGPPHCWKDAGFEQFENARSLLELSNASQQIYLALPPWEETWRRQWERRRARRQRPDVDSSPTRDPASAASTARE